ncbi:sterol desaturase [Sulfuricaulis limicola]|uniref:Sterol desaturase n=1 Tax=Sulfuricaulis limicola TaxID=1620215 RepID=A0A1B4XJJ4_9GAMM|nr:sterol desaturase family protein [Sulfuricaulis limicola]BAV34975.1 sterol desaturase [Sulfuricaulis limicola]
MLQALLQNETVIRLTAFFGMLVIVAGAEILFPRRRLTVSKLRRWASNLGIVFLNSALVRLLLPATAAGFAAFAANRGWGVFNYFSEAPVWFAIIASVVILDFAIYLQHVMFHAVPALWRLHRMHHADLDFDVTTGARFHPIEILLSMLIKFAVIAVVGAPVAAVIIFEVLLNATSMFNHGNLRLPPAFDRVLRQFIVTPDMHRVHHSIEDYETNSNFGFNLSLWDRLFGTYKAQPDAGHEAMTIGIRDFREPKLASDLPGMLILPFRGRVTGYAINRREWGGKS